VKSLEISLHDNSRIVLSWVRPGLLNVALWRPGSLGRDGILLLKSSRLLDGRELRDLQALLAGEQDEAKPEPPRAA
jgi:hypothetical protein